MTLQLEGKLTIRRSIFVHATPERVWREFETFDRFAAWFGVLVDEFDRHGVRRLMGHRVLTYEPRAGGNVEMEVETDGGAQKRFGGRITVFKPAAELTFEDDWIPSEQVAPLLLTLRLTAHDGGTMVELIQHGFEGLGGDGAETHRGHEGGWTVRQLDALRRIAEGE